MTGKILLLFIFIPVAAGVLALPIRRPFGRLKEVLSLVATAATLALAAALFKTGLVFSRPWAGPGFEFSLRLYHFSAFILLAASAFGFLVTLYCWSFMKEHPRANQFYAYMLFSLAMANGSILSDNLVLMLFFWEGLLGALFGMVAIGRPGAFRSATKMLIIVGISDLCMMAGIAMTGWLAHSSGEARYLSMSAISGLGLTTAGMGGAAMVFFMIGAIAKGGSMPFHSWIPDVAVDSPLPFMAIMPASLEKLLSIYLLTRISLDLFHMRPDSWMSILMMTVGAVTIVLAVMMALIQTDYKRLLAYHAISQVGYMVLGVGTAVPIGIVGGLFHMLNNAMYKGCLYLSAGSVEKQTGTTNLEKLGGIGAKMPVTFACFFIAAVAISGMPPMNGFYSKELIYDATLGRGLVFYLAALVGTFFTAASFLKLGHAVYLGRRDASHDAVTEAPLPILIPMIVIAGGCVLFGVYNALPLDRLIQPVLGGQAGAESFAGLTPHKWALAALTCVALGGALLNHLAGVRLFGSGLRAVEHIHHAPLLGGIYHKAEARAFDPYDIGLKLADYVARLMWLIDRVIDWVYDGAAVLVSLAFSGEIRKAHNGNYSLYVAWSLAGAIAVILFLVGWR